MTAWLTAAELAQRALPGLPASKRGVLHLAASEGWSSRAGGDGLALARQRRRQGGGLEFHISLLPGPARVQLEAEAAKLKAAVPQGFAAPAIHRPDATLKDTLRRDSRLALLSLADAFAAASRDGAKAAREQFVLAYNARAFAIPDWLIAEIPHTSLGSLARWRMSRDKGHWQNLAGRYGARRGSGILDTAADGEVAQIIAAYIVKQPFLSGFHLRDLIEARFGAMLATPLGERPLPNVRAFQRFASQWKRTNATLLQKIVDPDGFKSRARLSGDNAYAHVRALNQLWEIDASPADVLCTDGRHSIYVLADCWSRRIVTLVARTARTEAALLLLRKAVIAFGVPDMLRTDNGSDFTSHRFLRSLHALGIQHDCTRAFSPEQKGLIERAIGTLQRGLMPLLPGFVGHNVADRKQIEARRSFAQRLGETDENAFCVSLSAHDLQGDIDRWCADKYAHRPHEGIDGVSPFVKAQSWTGAVKKIENLRALDLLLAPVAGGDGWRQVTKQGIRLDHGYYISGALLAGQRVFVRLDPEDMGRCYAFESDTGGFLAEAVCPERAGVDPGQAVALARAEQQRFLKEGTAELRRQAKAIQPRDMVDAVLDLAGRKSATVTAFPKREDIHETPSLNAAEDALAVASPPAAPWRRVASPAGAHPSNVVSLPETGDSRFARALAIEARLSRAEPSEEAELLWLGSYRESAEYRSRKLIHEDFQSVGASIPS